MSSYTPPDKVYSPRRIWSLITVLDHGSEQSMAVALGKWDDIPVIALRWNGTEENPIGSPQSRGIPTWFIVERGKYTEAIINSLPADQQTLVRTFISVPERNNDMNP